MTNVIGLPPEAAAAILRREGVECILRETRSKKGIEEGTPFVVRQTITEDICVLTWSLFQKDTIE